MKYEDIVKANEQLKPIDIKGKDYIDVSQRIKAFRQVCPDGAIATEIISLDGGIVTMKATVYDENGKVLATGHAQEKETSSYINKTSFIENCETSAVGRALGICGFGLLQSVASVEEMVNAINNQGKTSPVVRMERKPAPKKGTPLSVDTICEAEEIGCDLRKWARHFGKAYEDLTDEEAQEGIAAKRAYLASLSTPPEEA